MVKVYLREPGLCESKHLKGAGSVSVLHFFHHLASLETTKPRPTPVEWILELLTELNLVRGQDLRKSFLERDEDRRKKGRR